MIDGLLMVNADLMVKRWLIGGHTCLIDGCLMVENGWLIPTFDWLKKNMVRDAMVSLIGSIVENLV